MTFDYDDVPVPPSTVADVIGEIVNNGKPPLLSEDEKLQRRTDHEIYLLECRQRDEQRRLEYQAAQEQAAAEAERQAAILAQRERDEWRKEYQARERERRRDNELVGLQIRTAQQSAWQQHVENATRAAVRQQQRQALVDQLEAAISPPPAAEAPPSAESMPEPEYPPEPCIGDPDYYEKWTARSPLRSWW